MTPHGRPRKLSELLSGATGQAVRKFGFAETRLLTHWQALMGEALGAQTLPLRLRFPHGRRREGTLYLRATGPAAIEVQHMAPQIIERLNAFFGYPAIAALRIEQGPLPPRARGPRLREPMAAADDLALKAVTDEGLRLSLGRLLAQMRARRGRAP
jgi:hypothetical protein